MVILGPSYTQIARIVDNARVVRIGDFQYIIMIAYGRRSKKRAGRALGRKQQMVEMAG